MYSVGQQLNKEFECLFVSCDLGNDRLQPNIETEKKQLEAWRTLVLDYCRFHKIYVLDVQEASTSPLFQNKSIDSKTFSLMFLSDDRHPFNHLKKSWLTSIDFYSFN